MVMVTRAPNNTNFAAQLGHMAGGYDAQYYMWRKVYCVDMFQTVFIDIGVLKSTGLPFWRIG